MELPSPPWGGVGVGSYFSEKQEVTYPTPAPPLHGRGVAGAQGFSFWHTLYRLSTDILVLWRETSIIWILQFANSGQYYQKLSPSNLSHSRIFELENCFYLNSSIRQFETITSPIKNAIEIHVYHWDAIYCVSTDRAQTFLCHGGKLH